MGLGNSTTTKTQDKLECEMGLGNSTTTKTRVTRVRDELGKFQIEKKWYTVLQESI